MKPLPAVGAPGQCYGADCEAFNQINNAFGYCLFHQAIRAMVVDANKGNVEVRRVLEKLGVRP